MEEPTESSTTSSISIENLPREILSIIFTYMDQKTVQSSTATCKLWFDLIRGNSNLSAMFNEEKRTPKERLQRSILARAKAKNSL